MLKELHTAAQGMLPQQTRLEVIANNMANASTTGFKRASVFERSLVEAVNHFNNVPGDSEQDDPPVGMYIDFSPGNLIKTDNPLDLAIDSPNAFFLLQDEEGVYTLTRNGNFRLTEDGYLISNEGKKLLAEDMRPISVNHNLRNEQVIEPSAAASISVNKNGEVLIDNKPVGRIQVVGVEDLNSLQQVSKSEFVVRASTGMDYIATDSFITKEGASIKQGYIEGSNVDIVSEMVQMIELQRLFELGSKVIQTNDDTLDKTMQISKF